MTLTATPATDERDDAPPPDPLLVRPWPDPVLDELGHDPRSAYCERFWLPLLGPSAVLLVRRLAQELDLAPDGFALPAEHGARALGLGAKGGRRSPFARTVTRLVQFRMAHLDERDGTLLVRRRLAPLTRSQVEKLPRPLRDEHVAWQAGERRTPEAELIRRRARLLALTVLESGGTPHDAERQLGRWRYHPAVAHEAATWAATRHTALTAATGVHPATPTGGHAPTDLVAGTGVHPATPTGGHAPTDLAGTGVQPTTPTGGYPPTGLGAGTGAQPATRTGGPVHTDRPPDVLPEWMAREQEATAGRMHGDLPKAGSGVVNPYAPKVRPAPSTKADH